MLSPTLVASIEVCTTHTSLPGDRSTVAKNLSTSATFVFGHKIRSFINMAPHGKNISSALASQSDCGTTGGALGAAHFYKHKYHFVQHPAVMAVSTLIELNGVTQLRANFTQEQIDSMYEFDPELAAKVSRYCEWALSVSSCL